MVVVWGLPCPTCGMTTAFAHTVRGRWLAAARAQPAGFVAAIATALLAGVSAELLARLYVAELPAVGCSVVLRLSW